VKIQIIAYTDNRLFAYQPGVHRLPGNAGGSSFEDRAAGVDSWNSGHHQQNVIEFAGRLCYESWDMPNLSTATSEGYIRNIIKQGHFSVLEHASVTFYVEGVSRNLSHELIRHRHLSFSELSQRYVNMSDASVVEPPAVTGYPDTLVRSTTHDDYTEIVTTLVEEGKTRKQAREAARYYLPSGVETKFVVTGNLRAWRDVLSKRHSKHADAEMQIFAEEILEQLHELYPNVFEDITKEM